jgi:hypothetical protein
MPRDGRVPDLLAGDALPYLDQVRCYVEEDEQDDQEDDTDVERAPPVDREDASVEEEDRELRDAYGDAVMDRGDVEPLRRVKSVSATPFPCLATGGCWSLRRMPPGLVQV